MSQPYEFEDEAEVVDGEIRLKPVSVIDRKTAWRQIREAQGSVRYTGPEPPQLTRPGR